MKFREISPKSSSLEFEKLENPTGYYTTETLDKAYLEYSNITVAITRKELVLQKEITSLKEIIKDLNKMGEFYGNKKIWIPGTGYDFSQITETDREVFPVATYAERYGGKLARSTIAKHKDKLKEICG